MQGVPDTFEIERPFFKLLLFILYRVRYIHWKHYCVGQVFVYKPKCYSSLKLFKHVSNVSAFYSSIDFSSFLSFLSFITLDSWRKSDVACLAILSYIFFLKICEIKSLWKLIKIKFAKICPNEISQKTITEN